MATVSIKHQDEYYVDIGTQGAHNMTSWQVAKDSHFFKVIDQSLEDPDNITRWQTPLPKLPEDKVDPLADEFYNDISSLWVRVKIHVGDVERDQNGVVVSKKVRASSEWLAIGPIDQREQDISVTRNGELIKTTTTKELGWIE